MNDDLKQMAVRFERANQPEDVFGEITGTLSEPAANLKQIYHRLAKVAHPDGYTTRDDQLLAQAVFTRLTEWYERAQTKLTAGVYGVKGARAGGWKVALTTKRGVYVLDEVFKENSLYLSYTGLFQQDGRSQEVALKIPRDPGDNDLAANEAAILRHLWGGEAANKFSVYLPHLLDSFQYNESSQTRQVNVFERTAGWHSLEQVHQAYPGGVDPQDMAWMWRRLLVALGFAHLNDVIHGAVLPPNILIEPEQHGLVLAEWSYALEEPQADGAHLSALDPAYQDWYPQEVLRKESPVPGTDIDMAARCMIYLLGGDPFTGSLPAVVAQPIRSFFKGCILSGKRARPQDAWALLEEFDALLQRLWGARKFHPFHMVQSQ